MSFRYLPVAFLNPASEERLLAVLHCTCDEGFGKFVLRHVARMMMPVADGCLDRRQRVSVITRILSGVRCHLSETSHSPVKSQIVGFSPTHTSTNWIRRVVEGSTKLFWRRSTCRRVCP